MEFVLLGNLTMSVHSCNWICHDQSDECNIIIFIHITSVQFDYVFNHEAHCHMRKLNPHLLNWNPNPELLAPNFNLSKIMSHKYRHLYATSCAVWFSMSRIKHEVASFTKIRAHVRWNWTQAQIWWSPFFKGFIECKDLFPKIKLTNINPDDTQQIPTTYHGKNKFKGGQAFLKR
jgi:hypothetical protein